MGNNTCSAITILQQKCTKKVMLSKPFCEKHWDLLTKEEKVAYRKLHKKWQTSLVKKNKAVHDAIENLRLQINERIKE